MIPQNLSKLKIKSTIWVIYEWTNSNVAVMHFSTFEKALLEKNLLNDLCNPMEHYFISLVDIYE